MIIAGVFARGGSKGVPYKNLRVVAGKSLVQRAVEQAKQVSGIFDVYCSTDSEDIASEARRHGAKVPWLRPHNLAKDTSNEWDSWVHLVKWLNEKELFPEYLMTVPCVAPLRTIEDLDTCLELALRTKADVVMAVSEANRNPWFNMVTVDKNSGFVKLVNEPKTRIHNRQSAPNVFDVTTVTFIIKCDFLLSSLSIYDGETRAVVLPRSHCLDIDMEEDIELADFLLNKKEKSEE